MFITAAWFDTKAPRTFKLGRSGVRRLGGTVLAGLVVVAAIFLISAFVGFGALFVPIFLLALLSKNGRPFFTRWVDGFEKLPAD